MAEKEPAPQPTLPVEIPVARKGVRSVAPTVDDLLDRERESEMLGLDYRPNEDPEDLDTYLDIYQNG